MKGISSICDSRMWLGASALALVIVSSAAAQEAASAQDEPSQSGVGDIIVTAQKREQSINRVGLTISALSGDTLQ